MRLVFLFSSLLLISTLATLAQVRTSGPPPQNLQLLKPTELQSQMGAYNRALGVGCEYCHMPADFATDDNHNKVVTRQMIRMTRDINERNFGDAEAVTCYTCHHGLQKPLAQASPAQ